MNLENGLRKLILLAVLLISSDNFCADKNPWTVSGDFEEFHLFGCKFRFLVEKKAGLKYSDGLESIENPEKRKKVYAAVFEADHDRLDRYYKCFDRKSD